MTAWKDEELVDIGGADELLIAPLRRDGTLQRPRIIWVVRLGDDLYVRSVNGQDGSWFRGVQARHAGHISAGGVDADVAFEDADHDLDEEIDEEYRRKYGRSPRLSTTSPARRHEPRRSGSFRARSFESREEAVMRITGSRLEEWHACTHRPQLADGSAAGGG